MRENLRGWMVMLGVCGFAAVGCGGSGPGPRAAASPRTLEATADAGAGTGEGAARSQGVDSVPEDGAGTPFAVSSAGRVIPHQDRDVVVIGRGPAIAEAVAEREAADSAPAAAPERPDSGEVMHRVAAGETLTSIARRYGVTPEAIEEANRLPNDRIRPGQMLVIPE